MARKREGSEGGKNAVVEDHCRQYANEEKEPQ
jgi:hypothetical protein